MKITSIELLPASKYLFIKLYTDEGIYGTGEVGAWGYLDGCTGILKKMEGYLIGQDPFRIEHHWNYLYRSMYFRGSILMSALSAIDIALWDIKGKALGVPVYELLGGKCQSLDEILPEVLAEVKPFEAQFGHDIPVFVAGGVYTGEDIAHYTKMGAAGAQLATRFIPTYECDASQTYKDVLLAANPEDVRIIHSPVGMPGRALATPLVQKLEQGLRFPPKHCARCLKACEPAKVPYCITHALIEAVKGNVEEGLFFCGANVGQLDRMRSVRELMDELVTEWRHNL